MQRVTNCILLDRQLNKVLLLKKPRRNWWVAPGGKMEPGETINQAVIREYTEETGIRLVDPQLKGVFTILVEEDNQVIDEWMLFTFFADQYTGQLLDFCPEGELNWQEVQVIPSLPKAAGDQLFFDHILNQKNSDILIKKFRYTPDYMLLGHE